MKHLAWHNTSLFVAASVAKKRLGWSYFGLISLADFKLLFKILIFSNSNLDLKLLKFNVAMT
jgi:hypothetical protein